MDISKNIVKIREGKGIKQYEVAEKLGIEPPNYSRLEKRGDKLTIEQLKQIGGALGVPFTDFLTLPDSIGIEKENNKRIKELEKWIEDKERIIEGLEVIMSFAESTIDRTLDNLLWRFMLTNNYANKVQVGNEIYNTKSQEELSDLFDNNINADFYFSDSDYEELLKRIKNDVLLNEVVETLVEYKSFQNEKSFWTSNFEATNYARIVSRDKIYKKERKSLIEIFGYLSENPRNLNPKKSKK